MDADYELPIAFDPTRANVSDTAMLSPMMESLEENHPEIAYAAEDLSADRGYGSEENNRKLFDGYGVKPIIVIRHMWKDGEATRPLFPDRADNIVYDQEGSIDRVGQKSGGTCKFETRSMDFCGFEKDRMTLKYRCPAAAYGFDCPKRKTCGASEYGRVVRVSMEQDRRLFMPIPRFERHFIRGGKDETADGHRLNRDVGDGGRRDPGRAIGKITFP